VSGFFSAAARLGIGACLASLVAACGYQAQYAAGPQGKLRVAVVRSLVPDAVAADEVAAGVREELVRAGALEAGEGYPRVEIEVLRADEASEGIVAGPSGPLSRATDIGIVARAWIAPAAGSRVLDTGDLRDDETIAVDPTAIGSEFHSTDALRAAARRLGHKLGAKLLGLP
jgi:hypothetical protein